MNLLRCFGTFTAGANGALSLFKFDYLSTLGIAAIVIFVGRFIIKHCALLRKYAIPAPVVSGLLFSALVAWLRIKGIIGFQFDSKLMNDLCQNVFFMCVGYSFSSRMAKSAGPKLLLKIAFLVVLLTTAQDVIGVAIGFSVGLNPLLALQCSSASMSGGVGTASAFGRIFEEMGAAGAVTVGVAASTLGNIIGSLIGGPVGVARIKCHGLRADPADGEALEGMADKKAPELSNDRMVHAFALALLITALGLFCNMILNSVKGITIPKFIGCLFAGAIARNLIEACRGDTHLPEMNAIEHMFLDLYLALILMSINIAALAPIAGQMSVVLVGQTVLMALFAYFITFNVLGRDYGAAVMAAGNCGWGCGAGPNALANEKAIMDEYGWHSVAWVVYPSLCLLINNIYNSTFLSICGSILAKFQ